MWRSFSISFFLMMVGALLLILFLVVGPPCTVARAKLQRVSADFHGITCALEEYKQVSGRYPSTEQGLDAFVTRPEIPPLPRDWKKMADAVPKDPWASSYRYRALPEGDARGFEIISAGKDGQFGTRDDLSSFDPE